MKALTEVDGLFYLHALLESTFYKIGHVNSYCSR
jgi:hypothetical protein